MSFEALLEQYARQHTRGHAPNASGPYLGENVHPDDGYWIARSASMMYGAVPGADPPRRARPGERPSAGRHPPRPPPRPYHRACRPAPGGVRTGARGGVPNPKVQCSWQFKTFGIL